MKVGSLTERGGTLLIVVLRCDLTLLGLGSNRSSSTSGVVSREEPWCGVRSKVSAS